MKIIQTFKDKYRHSCLAKCWHRYAPSITIPRRFFSTTVYFNLRDNIDDITRSRTELESREGAMFSIPQHIEGTIWDVGANIGLFSICAALNNKKSVAFELSPRACQLMKRAKERNRLDFDIISRPLSIDPISYTPPCTSSTENTIFNTDSTGDETSMTFQEAIESFGVPGLIKMDIEGGEIEFFNSDAFKASIMEHEIIWLVEVHEKKIGHYPTWEDVPSWSMEGNHDMYCSNNKKLKTLISRLSPYTENG